MLVETWTTSRRPRRSPSARTPGSPSGPPSRIAAATARASSSVAGGASSRLNAISGGRAETSVAPAVGCSSAGRSRAACRGAARPVRPALAQLGAGAPAGQLAVEEDGDAGGADRVGGEQRLGDRRAALRVVEVDDRRDVERADARVEAVVRAQVDPLRGRRGAGGERQVQLPGRAREEEDRAVVVGVGGAVQHVGVRRERARRSRRARPRRAPRTRWGRRRGASQHEAAGVEHARAADVERRVLDQAVEVDRHRRPCRRSRRSRRTRRGRCRASSRPRGCCRSASRARSSRRRARPGSAPCVAGARPSGRSSARPTRRSRRRAARRDGEADRLVGQAEARERRGDERPLAGERRDEALAARQVAERAVAR